MAQVVVESAGAVRVIRLARPEKKNALTIAMYTGMYDALQAAEGDDSVRVVLLTGAPGVFTAGNDIADFLLDPPLSAESPVGKFLTMIHRFPKPLVAAVDGAAVGVGTTMLLHCDLVLATTRARFILPFAKLGLVPEAASSYLLPRLVGYPRAFEWLVLGEPIDAETACRVGLVNRLVAPEALEEEALALAQAVAARPPEAVRLSKLLLRAAVKEQSEATALREFAHFGERLFSEEARNAFMAFLAPK